MSGAVVLIDVGNTRGKWLCVGSDGPVRRGDAAPDAVAASLPPAPRGTPALISSVAADATDATLRTALEARGYTTWFAQSHALLDGLRNGYEAPAGLGVDRWLAMLAALQRCRGRRFCVVDAGSALTIDFVAADGTHEGGFILPGRRLMERALQVDTGRVRYAGADVSGLAPGRSTAEAVGHGIGLALAGAVQLALARARRESALDAVLLCGGDAGLLAQHIDDAELAPDLVFEGLLRQARLEGFAVPGHMPSSLEQAAPVLR